MGTLVLFLGTAAVIATSALGVSCLRLRSLVGYLLATYVLATAEVIGISLLLSTGRWLTRSTLLGSIAALFITGLALWWLRGKPRPPPSRDSKARLRDVLREAPVLVVAVLAVVGQMYLLSGALTIPQSTPDALLYHLPRAALWKQQHGVGYVASSPDERVDAAPPNAEVEATAAMVMSGGDRYVSLVQLSALAATCLGIFGIARRLGLTAPAAAFGAFVFPTFTVIALQSQTALNDLVVASLLVAAAYFWSGGSRKEYVLGSVAVVLALGTKLTAVVALPVLALFVLASQPRRRWRELSVWGAAAMLAGSYWYVVNLAHTGRLDGGLAAAFPQSPDRDVAATFGRIWQLAMDLLELSGAESEGPVLRSPLPGVVVLGLSLVVAGVLLARGMRRASVSALSIGLFAAAATPMLIVWGEVARNGSQQAAATLGLAAAPSGPRVPAQLYESAMHSAYGLAFVLLLGGAGALVVTDVRHRSLPPAALVAVAGVPVTVVVLAVLLAYDPMRMRFLVFPVALGAATFGVALRITVLTWTAVALTAVNVVVSVGYFAPRPAGITLLSQNRGPDRAARWFVQGGSGGWSADARAFRFIEEQIPSNTTLALAVIRDTYVYPAWNGGLQRRVVFVAENDAVPADADWLVLGPRRSIGFASVPTADWRLALATERGWRIYVRHAERDRPARRVSPNASLQPLGRG